MGHAGISVAIWQTYSHEGHIIMNIHSLFVRYHKYWQNIMLHKGTQWSFWYNIKVTLIGGIVLIYNACLFHIELFIYGYSVNVSVTKQVFNACFMRSATFETVLFLCYVLRSI